MQYEERVGYSVVASGQCNSDQQPIDLISITVDLNGVKMEEGGRLHFALRMTEGCHCSLLR